MMPFWFPCVLLSLKVPKAVGRTDDAFQKCRSRALSATVEEVKLAELFDVGDLQWGEGAADCLHFL